MSKNIPRYPGYSNVFAWSGVQVDENEIKDFENFFLEEFDSRIQYLEVVEIFPARAFRTREHLPCWVMGEFVTIFAVHDQDHGKLVRHMKTTGIQWLDKMLYFPRGQEIDKTFPRRLWDYIDYLD